MKLKQRLLLSLSLLFSLSTVLLAQTDIEAALARYRQQFLPEKIFVHTDKNIYAGGETIWAAIYQIDGQSHQPDSLSRIIYLELRDPQDKMVMRTKVYPGDGNSSSYLDLPATIVPGNYQLTAYTNYQRNSGVASIFRKTIRILPGLKESGGVEAELVSTTTPFVPTETVDFKLRFFPEGGDCVNNISCRVAVVAELADGSPYSTSGYVTDGEGNTITIFKTNENGIGAINYTPREDDIPSVFAGKVQRPFELPIPLEEGLHLKVNQRKDTVRINLRSTLPTGLTGSTLTLHLRGIPILERVINERRDRALYTLPAEELPAGVITATLFDSWGEPVAERLFFVDPEDTQLQLQADTTHYPTRAPVDLFVKMPFEDAPVDSLGYGRISLSVIAADINGGASEDDIRSWLLLNSDLDKPIPDARRLLFATSKRARERKIEDYLLTREWRRFRWEAITKDAAFLPAHKLEQGIYLRGRMGKYENKKAARPGKIFLSRLENGFEEAVMTDEQGHFSFGPYLLFDTLDVTIQGRFKPGKKNRLNPKIDLDDNSYVHLETYRLPGPQLPTVSQEVTDNFEPTLIENYEDISRKSLTVARNFDSLIIDLDVVDVVTKRIDPVEESRLQRSILYNGEPDNRVIVDSIPWARNALSIFQLLRTVPGVIVSGNAGQESVQIRGQTSILLSNEPAFFIDGIQTDIEGVRSFPVLQVEFVDVVKGARASIFGIRGGNGAILIYTRRGGSEQVAKQPGLIQGQVLGYHKTRQFASFDADKPDNRNRPDIRTTLHWNPDLRTNHLGLARDEILTSDQTGKFIIVAQGLRRDGRPFYGSSEFFVVEETR
ncbi:MAG: TonB-dependent receptor plug domain-containing protein [Bacteroidota bacterium]